MIVNVAQTPAEAIRITHAWFEVNSGWAPPDDDTLAEWIAEGVCRCPDGCLAAPDGWCEHGLASWWIVLADIDAQDRAIAERRTAKTRRETR